MAGELLYKYKDWEHTYGKDILINQSLFLSSFVNFNDPFDSDIMVNYEDLTDAEIEKVAARNVDIDYPGVSRFNRRLLINKFIAESALGDPEELKKNYINAVRPQNEEELGILSLSKVKNNILMWSHYANCHKGYCVGFDKAYLSELADEYTLKKHLTVFEDVTYSREYPNINPASDDLKVDIYPILTKSIDWEYEQEVRLIIKDVVNTSIEIDKKAILEVILGLKICDKSKNEILEVVRQKMPHVDVYKAEKKEKEFALKFRKVKL